MATKLLANQLRSLLNDPVEGFTVEADEVNFFEWKVWIEGPKDTCYAGGVFQLSLKFPKDYPMSPPELKLVSDFWHPNVFANGKVCMSILHPPGEDAMSGELPEERWLPTQSVTTIILSLMSLLNDPNCASPANVDASVEWRNHREAFKNRCHKLVEKANRERPANVVIPHPETDVDQRKRRVQKFHEMNKDLDYDDFYENEAGDEDNNESGDENEFLESDNDEEINTDDEQSPKALSKPKETRSRSDSSAEGADSEKKAETTVHLEVIQPDLKKDQDEKGKAKANDSSAESIEEEISTVPVSITSSIALPSSSSTNPSSSQSIALVPTPLTESSNSNSNNNNNNIAQPVSNKKEKRRGGGKKGKKCVIM